MSERLEQCPECNTTDIVVLKVHNPETMDMNSDATLQCTKPMCEHTWEGRTASNCYQKQREWGWII